MASSESILYSLHRGVLWVLHLDPAILLALGEKRLGPKQEELRLELEERLGPKQEEIKRDREERIEPKREENMR